MTSRSIFPAAWEARSILEAMAQISVIDEEVSSQHTVESRLSQVAPRNSQVILRWNLDLKTSETMIIMIYWEKVGKGWKNYEEF